jgi:hypothetical protein
MSLRATPKRRERVPVDEELIPKSCIFFRHDCAGTLGPRDTGEKLNCPAPEEDCFIAVHKRSATNQDSVSRDVFQSFKIMMYTYDFISYRGARAMSLKENTALFLVDNKDESKCKVNINMSVFVNLSKLFHLGEVPTSQDSIGNGLHIPSGILFRLHKTPKPFAGVIVVVAALGEKIRNCNNAYSGLLTCADISSYASNFSFQDDSPLESIRPKWMAPFIGFQAIVALLKFGRSKPIYVDPTDKNNWVWT